MLMDRDTLAPLAAAGAVLLCCAAGPLIVGAIAGFTLAAILGVSVAVCALALAAAAAVVLRRRGEGQA